MLFNGKYYNKPGHLGMTRQQLKEALAGGKIDCEVVNLTPDGFDKTFAEINEWVTNNKLAFCIMGSQITSHFFLVDENTINVIFNSIEFDEVNARVKFLKDIIVLSSDNTVTGSTIEARVNATFVS